MISQKQLYKDIEDICQMCDAIYGCYAELHEYDKDGRPVKLPQFVEKAKALMGKKAAFYLYSSGLLKQSPGGEYDFAFPMEVTDGGGMSYNCIGDSDGYDYRLIYFFDDKDDNDKHNIYHELGHLMQFRNKLFRSKEINKIYSFMRKSAKISHSKIANDFVSSYNYQQYLYETHANSFATFCMLLRTPDKAERQKCGARIYLQSGYSFFEGLRDKSKNYPGMKYYASMPVQKAVIKEVSELYKNGEILRYITPDGKIDFDAVAFRTRDIVMQKAYSPRVFNQFLNMDFISSHNRDEIGWRHSIPEVLVLRTISQLGGWSSTASTKERSEYHEKVDLQRHRQAFVPLPEKDKEARLINICCQLDDAFVEMNNCAEFLDIDISKYDELDLGCAIKYGSIPDSVVRSASQQMLQETENVEPEDIEVLLIPYQMTVNKLLQNCQDKDDVYEIMNAMVYPHIRSDVWNMYYRRYNDSEADIRPQNLHADFKVSTDEQLRQRSNTFKKVREAVTQDMFPQSHSLSPQIRQKVMLDVLETARYNPDKLGQNEYKRQIKSRLENEPLKKDYLEHINSGLDKLHVLYFIDDKCFGEIVEQCYESLRSSIMHQTGRTAAFRTLKKSSKHSR